MFAHQHTIRSRLEERISQMRKTQGISKERKGFATGRELKELFGSARLTDWNCAT